jgi:hypothetical protein
MVLSISALTGPRAFPDDGFLAVIPHGNNINGGFAEPFYKFDILHGRHGEFFLGKGV